MERPIASVTTILVVVAIFIMMVVGRSLDLPDWFFGGNRRAFGQFEHPMGLIDTEDTYELTATIHQFSPNDIQVQVEGHVVTVTADREYNDTKNGVIIHSHSSWKRVLNLGHKINPEDIKATFRDGRLKVLIKKPMSSLEISDIPIKHIDKVDLN